MGAIAGLIRLDGENADHAISKQMEAVLTPYGKDAQNHWQQGPAVLVRTLLRVVPEDAMDCQPQADDQKDIVVVFDGRLDNRGELAETLGLTSSEIALMSDGELAFHACCKWDRDTARHLLGDFAMACFHPQARCLWLARDPLGTRPLFWHQQDHFFAFATLPKALFTLPGVRRALNRTCLENFLALLPVNGRMTLFKDIFRVEPGQLLVMDEGRLHFTYYHRFDPEHRIYLASDDDYLEAFREQVNRAVSSRMRSVGAIASHLSSGYDSATVTAFAAQLAAKNQQRLIAYTAAPRAGFNGPVPPGRHGDESLGAAAVASRFANIDHHVIRPDNTTFFDILPSDIETWDTIPLNPMNMVWLDAIKADAGERGVKVLLTGQMGNMTLSYNGLERLPGLLKKGRWRSWWQEGRALMKTQRDLSLMGMLKRSIGPYLPHPLWQVVTKVKGNGALNLSECTPLHPKAIAGTDWKTRAKQSGYGLSYRPWADGRKMRIATIHWIDQGHHYASANTFGLELRDPTCDRRLIEFCLAIPDSQYLKGGESRLLLRRLMEGILPEETLRARTKGLQAADWYEGITALLPRLKCEIGRLADHDRVQKHIDLTGLAAIVDNWPHSGWEQARVAGKCHMKLTRGLAAAEFIRYVEGS